MAPTARMKQLLGVFLWLFALLGCERSKSAVPAEGLSAVHSSPSVPAGAAVWDDMLGPLIATPSTENGTPTLFMRDTVGTAELELELFNHEGRTQRAILRPATKLRSCAWQRTAALVLADGAPVGSSWSLALAPGTATAIAIDDASELLPRDSAALVVRINRLVSALPDDSASAAFRGLPIVVRDAWRFHLPDDSTMIIVAVATRSLNVESNPRTEVVTIIAEPSPTEGAGEWRTAFVRRDAGPEDRVSGVDLLAALRLKNSRNAVALVRDRESGLAIDVVERIAPGSWRIRWSSAALPCFR